MEKNQLLKVLKIPVTDLVLEKIGFTDYDDEHCTWGNRRLMFGNMAAWYKLQIVEYCDYPEENGREVGFSYQGWFEIIPNPKPNNAWDIITVRDIYKIIYLYHPEWLNVFKQKLQKLL
jgi:hypothetical protein